MSGIKYRLDTNYILGLLQSNQAVLSEAISKNILVTECAYSPITRMELLGFPGITSDEDNLIRTRLQSFTVIPLTLTTEIEDSVIALRQTSKRSLDAMKWNRGLIPTLDSATLHQGYIKNVAFMKV